MEQGYVEPNTGRVAVLASEFAASDLNGDAAAYTYNEEAVEFGLDPWRVVEGIDPHVGSDKMDLWFASGSMKTVGPDALIFVKEQHAAQLGVLTPAMEMHITLKMAGF